MIHHHIDRAIALVEHHQNQIDMYEDVFEWGDERNSKVRFSDDDTEFTYNIIVQEGIDNNFLSYCKKELRHHYYELEKAQQRLRLCMWTFNRGWTF